MLSLFFFSFFFNDTATTEIYTLSLHDALPIFSEAWRRAARPPSLGHGACVPALRRRARRAQGPDRKSTRLNSSHPSISYAVFCLKKKKIQIITFVNNYYSLSYNTNFFSYILNF